MKTPALLLLLLPIAAQAQVGIGTSNPASSAQLEISATNKGMLIPRVTFANRPSSPATGLMIYQTDNTPGFYYFDGTNWINVSAYILQQNITTNGKAIAMDGTTNGINLDSNGIVVSKGTFGSGKDLSESGAGTRMMWYPKKGAFRAGTVFSTQWNNSSIGDNSFAAGAGNLASGSASSAFGNGNTASAGNSAAFGTINTASGANSFVSGAINTASGASSAAFNGQNAASGGFSSAFGNNNIAKGAGTMAIGVFNDTILTANQLLSPTNSTPLFIVGNGSSTTTRSNAMVVYKNGTVGIGKTIDTTAFLHIDLDTFHQKGFLVTGDEDAAGAVPDLGPSTSMMFYPGKAAFRAGTVTSTQWNNANTGHFSFAAGKNVKASGTASVALGLSCSATEEEAFAAGLNCTASGVESVALGGGNVASGLVSMCVGTANVSSGVASFCGGASSEASGDFSLVIGSVCTAAGAEAIALGDGITASGANSVGIGKDVTVSGNNSFGLGRAVSTNSFSGAFIIGDGNTTTTSSSVANQMTMRFSGGYRLFSNSASTIGVSLAANGNSWASISDVRRKENFIPVDGEKMLQHIASFKLTSWNYKGQDPKQFRHYGPMAQDFYKAFGHDEIGVIGNDTTIASADFDGVNLIAIQALEKRTRELHAKCDQLQQQLNMLLEERYKAQADKKTAKQ